MSARLSEGQMARFTTFVETWIGLRFSPSSRGELEQRIAHAALETGFPSSVEFVEQLTRSPLSKEQLETLASHLTVGETYFWRDKETFRVFQERIIPKLVARRREEGKLADYEASISSIAFSPDCALVALCEYEQTERRIVLWRDRRDSEGRTLPSPRPVGERRGKAGHQSSGPRNGLPAYCPCSAPREMPSRTHPPRYQENER